jgi:hypothetical protein
MTYAETVFLFVSLIGFSGVWYLLYSVRQELEAIRLLLATMKWATAAGVVAPGSALDALLCQHDCPSGRSMLAFNEHIALPGKTPGSGRRKR